MNCRNFTEIATSIARAELIDAAVLEDARTHAGACARCGSQLADEMRLSEGLKLLARSDESRVPVVVDEIRLRQAFRLGATEALPLRRRGAAFFRLAAAIAAVLIVVLAGSLMLRQVKKNETLVKGTSPVAKVTPDIEQEKPSTQQALTPIERQLVPAQAVASTRRSRVKPSVRDGSYVDVRLVEFRPTSDEPEETTEFVPTSVGSEFAPLNSGQVVRVMVPKSAMSYFGLPVNVERANERVAADVLLGEDGLAKAIRFVR